MIKEIRRIMRKQYGPEEKTCIVLEEMRVEALTAALCRREGIAEIFYDNWSKKFLEDDKKVGR